MPTGNERVFAWRKSKRMKYWHVCDEREYSMLRSGSDWLQRLNSECGVWLNRASTLYRLQHVEFRWTNLKEMPVCKKCLKIYHKERFSSSG
jgi:hypothetical protein